MDTEVQLRLIGTAGGVRALVEAFERLGAEVSRPYRPHNAVDPTAVRQYVDLSAEQIGSLLIRLAPPAYGMAGFLAALSVAAEEWLERDGDLEPLRGVLTKYLQETRLEYEHQARSRGAAEVIAKPPESDP